MRVALHSFVYFLVFLHGSLTYGARPGSTASAIRARRTTTVQTSVSNEAELRAAIGSDTVITLLSDIYLTAPISIIGIVGLKIEGNNKKIDGQGACRCLYVYGSYDIELNDLTVTNGDEAGGGGIYSSVSGA